MNTTLPPWIAIVDDEEGIRRALLRLLRSVGIPARAYASGTEFLDALAGGHPCCAVLDIHMPGMSGLELQERLAELAPEVTVVIMTGQQTAAEQTRAMQHKALCYLLKPVNDAMLLEAIHQACRFGPWRHHNNGDRQS